MAFRQAFMAHGSCVYKRELERKNSSPTETLCWSGTEHRGGTGTTHPFIDARAVRVLPRGALMRNRAVRGRYGRRYHRRARRLAVAGVLVLLPSLILVVALTALSNLMADLRVVVVIDPPESPPIETSQPAREPTLPERPVFRHSVVSGGVYTANEVATAIERDRIVAAHYSGVNVRQLRAETVSEARAVYMSYRIGDEIFWTKEQVGLRLGETILTDGIHGIRARCGNAIAFTPMEPTAHDEPDAMEFETPAATIDVIPSRLPFGSGWLFQPPGIPLPWLPQFSPDIVAGHDPRGSETIGIPWYLDPLNPELTGGGPTAVLFPVDDDWRFADTRLLPPLPVPASSTPDPRDPGDPDRPGNEDDPGSRGNPGDPFDPNLTPLQDPVVAPEPATLLLVGGGLATLAVRRRRRR